MWGSLLVVALVVGSVLGLVAWFSVLVVALMVGSVLGLVAWFSVWHVHQHVVCKYLRTSLWAQSPAGQQFFFFLKIPGHQVGAVPRDWYGIIDPKEAGHLRPQG
jgi:hypothetical protein